MSLDVGQTYRAALMVVDGNGQPVNPITSALTVTTPDQIVSPLTISNPQTGVLQSDYTLAQAGLHAFDWLTTGPGIAQTDYENVRRFRALGSLAEVREMLAIADTGRDQTIRTVMAAATQSVERIVGTCIQRQIVDEFIPGDYRDSIRLLSGPLPNADAVTSVTSVWQGGPTWTGAELVVNPDAATVRLASFLPFWFGPWRATYAAGRVEIAPDITQGWKDMIWDMWATYRGNLTDQQEPDLAEVAAFENSLAGYMPPGRITRWLEGERRPGFA